MKSGVADRNMLYIEHFPLSGEIPSSVGDFEITATVIPYSGASLSSGSPKIEYQIDGGSYQSITMENNGGYEYSGYIPSIPFGGEIGYYLYATDVSGNTANHPFIGSPDPHIFQVVSTEMQMEITHLENWNLVGLPLLVNNSEYFELFPSATENSCYSYTETGY